MKLLPNSQRRLNPSTSASQEFYRLVAEWSHPETKQRYVFTRNGLDKREARRHKIGKGVSVLIDMQNPKRYWVDV